MFDLKVGFTCNNKCLHCVVEGKKDTKDLTLEEIKHIVDNNVAENDTVVLTGGEVSIRKDFYDIVKYCYDKGHPVSIQTNGTGFNEEVTKKVAPYISNVLIAIHSCDESVHNKIVQCKGEKSMYDLTLKGFRNLIKFGVRVETQTVLSTLNIHTLYDTYKMIQEIAPMCYMHLTYPHPMGSAYTNHDIICPRYSDIKKYISPIIRDFGTRLVIEAIPHCYIHPWYQSIELLIDSDIKHNKINRVGYDKSIENVRLIQDYNSNDLSEKRKSNLCRNCAYDFECIGVWKEYAEFYNDNLDLYPICDIDDRSISRVYVNLHQNTDQIKLNKVLNRYKNYEIIPYGDINEESIATLKSGFSFIRPYVRTKKNLYLLNEFSEINLYVEDSSLIDTIVNDGYSNTFYVDFNTSKLSFLEIKEVLDKMSCLNVGYCRIFSKDINADKEKLNGINKISTDYNYQIVFLNNRFCNFTNYAYLIQELYIKYIDVTDSISENDSILNYEKRDECLNCKYESKCFGFNLDF